MLVEPAVLTEIVPAGVKLCVWLPLAAVDAVDPIAREGLISTYADPPQRQVRLVVLST